MDPTKTKTEQERRIFCAGQIKNGMGHQSFLFAPKTEGHCELIFFRAVKTEGRGTNIFPWFHVLQEY